jgi:hypothetical protein
VLILDLVSILVWITANLNMMLAYNENNYDQYAPNRQPNFLQKLYE